MPGDDKSEPPPPPPTMEGLAAQMTKLLSSMGDMETRFTSMESGVAHHLYGVAPSTAADVEPHGVHALWDARVRIYNPGEFFIDGRRHAVHGTPNVFADPADHQGSVRRHKGYNSPDTSRSPGDDTT